MPSRRALQGPSTSAMNMTVSMLLFLPLLAKKSAAWQALVPLCIELKDKEVDVMARLQKRSPSLDWNNISPVPSEEFMKLHSWCRKALKRGPSAARERTAYFMKFVQSVLHDKVKRTRNENTYQLFDEVSHRWLIGSRDRFQKWVQEILMTMFHHEGADGEEPLPPLGQGELARKILHDLSGYLPVCDDDNFDGDFMRHKIQYANNTIKDYRTKELRCAQPGDRARFHTARAYEGFDAPAELQELWKSTVQMAMEFWKHGGKSFEEANAEGIVQNLETLAGHESFHLLKALKTQWSSPSAAVALGWDMVIYILWHVTRAFSSHERLTEMMNTTGPRNSGKSFVVVVLSRFHGGGHKNYVGSLDKDYFTRPPAKTGTSNADSGRNPALAQNRNKRFTVVPASPDVFSVATS